MSFPERARFFSATLRYEQDGTVQYSVLSVLSLQMVGEIAPLAPPAIEELRDDEDITQHDA